MVYKPVTKISTIPLVVILIILFGGQSCVSKRLARQAEKYEDAGLYEMAAENYLRSFNANPKNINAATGLRRTGQRTLEAKADLVKQAWIEGDDRETVYRYQDALAYQRRVRASGIDLAIPAEARSYYQEAKPRFLESSFDEARLLLEEENFGRAEILFSEIHRIEPNYQNLNEYMRVSRSEPLYRQAVEQLNSGFYRNSYQTLSLLIDNHGPYKDAIELRKDALDKGRITIAIADFDNLTRQRNVHSNIKSLITSEISKINDPFTQVIDDRNINAFLREQEVAARLGSDIKTGRIMAARAILTGRLLEFEITRTRIQRTERKAFLKEEVEVVDNVTREKSTKTVYHKVNYYEYRGENSAAGSFEYKLSSTETGAVLLSGLIKLNPSDQVHYAVFEGNPERLVPGHWEYKDRDSPKDRIMDENRHVRNLQALFKARQNIKSTDILQSELINGIAHEVSRAVTAYNPER